jgi:hypothetical protein
MFILARESVPETSTIPNQQSWPLRITATYQDGGAPANIFVYQSAVPPLDDQDFFVSVAGVPQMSELPVGSPAEGVPYYRTHALLVIARSADHADEFWTKIRKAAQDLADNLALAASLAVGETTTITPNA